VTARPLALFALGVMGLMPRVAPAAPELKVLSAVGMRQVVLGLREEFERTTGQTLVVTFDSSGLIAKRIASGESADIVLINRSGIDDLAASGKVIPGTVTDIARSVAAVAVRKGARRPDISSPDAFKQLLLSARSVARPPPGVGGSSADHIVDVLERLGITAAVNAKSVFVMTGAPGQPAESPGDAVAKGKAEIALHQLQELMAVPGIEIVGPFPGDLQGRFVFSGAISSTAKSTDAGRTFIEFLRTPHAREVMRAKGMEPAS
jgi:molybdate transport system substrate-binding protein